MDTLLQTLRTRTVEPFQVAEIEVHYKTNMANTDRPQVYTSQSAYEILRSNWNEGTLAYREEFKILLLNRNNRVLGIVDISKGGVASSLVDTKLVFGAALLAHASAIILAHNHPSGNILPSTDDKRMTQKLIAGGALLDIAILDHIILASYGYYSFADAGILKQDENLE